MKIGGGLDAREDALHRRFGPLRIDGGARGWIPRGAELSPQTRPAVNSVHERLSGPADGAAEIGEADRAADERGDAEYGKAPEDQGSERRSLDQDRPDQQRCQPARRRPDRKAHRGTADDDARQPAAQTLIGGEMV